MSTIAIAQHFKNMIEKSNIRNTHITFFICALIFSVINVYLNIGEPFKIWVELVGTLLQILLPCYALVPILWKKDRVGFFEMLKMLAFVVAVTWIFKLGLANLLGINDTRPFGGKWSFPSGHTAGAFLGVVFLSLRYGLKYFLIAFPLGLYVAFSRLYVQAHWPTDVIGSIILCVIAGIIFVRTYKSKIS